ncbi:Pentatricopeptide repeat-containing protein [Neolecta irregularis DAH-3]|uniref:Pentatricopeptide repeat-containing protein n=1 Tax=Neolecta irregularis (strain DAH-3) TaxID=1198029 RepID=A0A1U7LUN6_NEOID|nr:Pentatricopeptide repeat-containing protein [Neolecta irregularis DAH-3]|eukprot:OLL26390.1 Pentatricopeptide repeat-containing protein [Neolecta irregularis DAH-3]
MLPRISKCRFLFAPNHRPTVMSVYPPCTKDLLVRTVSSQIHSSISRDQVQGQSARVPQSSRLEEYSTTLLPTWKINELSCQRRYRGLIFDQAALYVQTKTPPDLNIYAAVFRAMSMSDYRLCDEAMALFSEMIERNIPPILDICELVIKLSSKSKTGVEIDIVLNYMKRNNIKASAAIWHWRIIHAFESQQTEVGLSLLEEADCHLSDQTYLFAISKLCEINEAETALYLIRMMMEDSREVTIETWFGLLKASAVSYFYEGVNIAWSKTFESGNILPSEGLAISVLHVAGRYAVPKLATSVMKAISMQGIEFQEHHYAPLLESYARAGDTRTAFILLHIIRQGNTLTPPSAATAYPIFKSLIVDPENVDRAFFTLKDIFEESKQVDIVAFNTVINLAIFHQDLEKAVTIYKEAEFFSLKPNVETYNALLGGAKNHRHGEFARFIWNEMTEAHVLPNQESFEKMIQVICTLDDYEDVFQYLEMEKAAGFTPSRSVYAGIIKKCVAHRDARANIALQEMVSLDYESGLLERWIQLGGKPQEVPGFYDLFTQLDFLGYIENSRSYGGAGEKGMRDVEVAMMPELTVADAQPDEQYNDLQSTQ